MREKTNLGTLGKVLEIMKEQGIVDIPETIEPLDIAFAITCEMSADKITELLNIVTNSDRTDYSDDEGVEILESFFMNMGNKLPKFVKILTREFVSQKDMAIGQMNKVIDQMITQAITSETAIDFSQNMDLLPR
jgi:hypothetical protein